MIKQYKTNYTDKDGNIIKEKLIIDNIFRPVADTSYFKKTSQTIINNTINALFKLRNLVLDNKIRNRRIHRYVKYGIIHFGMKFAEKVISKFLVKNLDDIPAEAYNNHIRMWYHSWQEGHNDMWRLALYQRLKNYKHQHPEIPPTGQDYLNMVNDGTNRSFNVRKLMGDLYITEVLEDSSDREMLNCFSMRLAHNMMKHYGVSREERNKVPVPENWKMFTLKTQSNPEYFIHYGKFDSWKPNDKKESEVIKDEDVL